MSELITKLNPALVMEAMQAPTVIYEKDSIEQLTEGSYKSHIYDSDTGIGIIILDSSFIERLFNDSPVREVQLLNVTSIGERAFWSCKSLTSITIPDSVTSIGKNAFCGCRSLTIITIPDSVTSIGDNAFSSCTSLKSVTIGNSVIAIGIDAFYNCSSLKSVTIPDRVTKIDKYAFYYCSTLKSVTIPDSVTSIGEAAFFHCSSLTNVYCKPTTPPTGGMNMFNYNASGRKIYVPLESVDAYKSAEWWSEYADQIVGVVFEDEMLESGTTIKTINGQSILGEGNIDVLSSVNIATSAEIEALFTNTSSSEN